MAKPSGPVHILRQWDEKDFKGMRALSRRWDVEPGTWCGLLNWDGAFKCARRSLGEEEDM